MHANPIRCFFSKIFRAGLVTYVHVEAFCTRPVAYLTATKWWFKRKRVRARAQFAPLLGMSSKAYPLWLSRRKQAGTDSRPDPTTALIAIIDATRNHSPRQLALTIASVANEGLTALVIGAPEMPTLAASIDKLDWAGPVWLLPLSPGDKIASGAAAAYCAAMGGSARVVYADDDLLVGRKRRKPHFKPDWNGELFAHYDFVSGSCALSVSRSDMAAVADHPEWEKLLVSRLSNQSQPRHIRQILHHRNARPASLSPVLPLATSGELPSVTIIIPTRNRGDLLKTCIAGIGASNYRNPEIIIVDNDSDDPATLEYLAELAQNGCKVLRHSGPFNYSQINNRAVDTATGDLICLLNNDIEVIEPEWLATLATQAMRPEVGAVGARLLYPDGRIQHAGVSLGIGGAAGHSHRLIRPEEEGYFGRHNFPQFTTAVTAACLVVAREKFLAVGGFDEKNFAVAFNDVDFCLRLNQRGWQSLYEPRATLIHHESLSRGFDRDAIGAARFAKELSKLKQIWKTDTIVDPYHHPDLTRGSEQFAIGLQR